MKQWMRRLRGVLGIGSVWAAVGAAVGSVSGVFVSISGGLPLLQTLAEFGLGAGALGFALGSAFASVLTMLEKRRTIDELSPGHAAGWGGGAGALLALIVVGVSFLVAPYSALSLEQTALLLVFAPLSYGTVSAALAAGTVALAKSAPAELAPTRAPDGGELLGAPADG